MRKTIVLGIVLFLFLLPAAMSAPSSQDSSTAKIFADVRQATYKYHNVSVAETDGYVPLGGCVENPTGVMGIHYGNIELLGIPPVETEPSILLYVNSPNGGKRLVGVEYFAPALMELSDGTVTPWVGEPENQSDLPPGQDTTWNWLPSPMLFGRPLDGPMAGHEPGMIWHYDLHVWLWQGNPSGIFAAFNPTIKCG